MDAFHMLFQEDYPKTRETSRTSSAEQGRELYGFFSREEWYISSESSPRGHQPGSHRFPRPGNDAEPGKKPPFCQIKYENCQNLQRLPYFHLDLIRNPGEAMIAERKSRFPMETGVLSKKECKERVQMSSNNNRINVPQAKQAMEQFKMQAASEEDVSSTS